GKVQQNTMLSSAWILRDVKAIQGDFQGSLFEGHICLYSASRSNRDGSAVRMSNGREIADSGPTLLPGFGKLTKEFTNAKALSNFWLASGRNSLECISGVVFSHCT